MPRKIHSKNKVAKCPLCSFETKLLPHFERHIVSTHKLTSQKLWDSLNDGPKLCSCGCGRQTTWVNWHVGYRMSLKGHWHKGKTKYDDERVARLARSIRDGFTHGRRVAWSKGLNKESDDRIRRRAEATSEGLRRAYVSGSFKSWSKGLTKDIDDRLKKTSLSLMTSYVDGRRVAWMKGLTKDDDDRILDIAKRLRLRPDDIKNRIESTGRYVVISSLEHHESTRDIITAMCTTCGTTFERRMCYMLNDVEREHCRNCRTTGTSKGENEIGDFIANELCLDIIRNDRTLIAPKELDIYVPSKKFAIEFNGLYWHGDNVKRSKFVHAHKTKMCMYRGVRLLHVFEDEWYTHRDIVKSMIRAKLDVGMTRVHARRCDVVEVPRDVRIQFFDSNHLDGDITNVTRSYGLVYDGELVQCVSIRSSSNIEHGRTCELVRLASATNTYVIGGISRLTTYIMHNLDIDTIVTYVDERFGHNDTYSRAGWQFVRKTHEPSFWWTDGTYRYPRTMLTKGTRRSDIWRIYGCLSSVYGITR